VAFALFSRGYRRGGFNAILVGQPQSVIDQLAPIGASVEFAQERLDNYEMGLKSTWLDNRVRTRLVGYYQMWRKGQVPSTISYVAPNGGVVQATVTTNAGAVNLYGIELEADFAVAEHLTVNAAANYQGSEITRYNYIPTGPQINRKADISGNKFWGFPVVKASVSPTYTNQLTQDWDWYARGDYRYRGRYYIDGSNLAWISPSHLIDFRLGVQSTSLLIEAYVENLFDDRHFTQGQYGADSSSTTGASNENEIRLGLPLMRTFGVKAIYTF
jgi:iron complex outermembrane receptor protein